MLISEKDEDNSNSYNLTFELNESISSFNRKDDNYINNEITKIKEKKIFTIKRMKNNIFKKKEINSISQKGKIKGVKGEFFLQKEAKKSKDFINNQINNHNKVFVNQLLSNKFLNVLYRKDAYYKHFKVKLGKFIKNKVNILKNKCFPYYSRNNFSTPNYKYTGNPKEKENFLFLSFTIKDILIYGKDKTKYNRQYNNELLINYIEKNEIKASDKDIYKELIKFLNTTLEDAIMQFYDSEKEMYDINHDSKFTNFDKFYKRETGFSLLEQYGFLKALKK